MPDLIVIGAGLNGLVAGTWLARQKLSTVILDQRPLPGGAALTSEFVPGFRAPALSHSFGPIHRDVVRALRLDRAGLEFITPDPALTALGHDGRTIVFHRDPVLTAAAIHRHSAADAGRWRDFLQTTAKIASIAGALNRQLPPPIEHVPPRELWRLAQVGRRLRALGSRDLARLVRWLPMSVADFAAEWFETDLLQAALAARAVFGNFAGPWSAGTGAMLLERLTEDPMPIGSGVTVRGGPGALTQTLASLAQRAGATVTMEARVARIITKDGRAVGVALQNGDEIRARAILAAIDVRQTLLHLVDQDDVTPTVRERTRNIRVRGVTAKVNLALSAAPVFRALDGDVVPLRGRFLVAPDVEYIERAFDAAKYGQLSELPWLEIAVPTIADPSLTPEHRHVLSMYVHFAPRALRQGTWNDHRESIYRAAMHALTPHAPDLESLVIDGEVLTPEDLEQHWSVPGGHIFHGETTLDQTWVARPLLGWARYQSPVPGLFLGGAGTHPGGGLTGMSGLLAAKTVLRTLKP